MNRARSFLPGRQQALKVRTLQSKLTNLADPCLVCNLEMVDAAER